MKARASIGTANRLGLEKGRNAVEPTTAYLLLERGCSGKCIFCLQGQGDASKVSRVEWPQYEHDEIGSLLNGSNFKRICIQTSIYPELEEDLAKLLKALPDNIKVSVSISPLANVDPFKLKQAGVERLGIPIDGATKEITTKAKGFSEEEWNRFFDYLFDAIDIFDTGKVATHVIVGLGESEKNME